MERPSSKALVALILAAFFAVIGTFWFLPKRLLPYGIAKYDSFVVVRPPNAAEKFVAQHFERCGWDVDWVRDVRLRDEIVRRDRIELRSEGISAELPRYVVLRSE